MGKHINGEFFTEEALALWKYLSEQGITLFNTPSMDALGERMGLSHKQMRRYLSRMHHAGMIYRKTYQEKGNTFWWYAVVPVPEEIFLQSFHEEKEWLEAAEKYAAQTYGDELKRYQDRFKIDEVRRSASVDLPYRLYEILQAFSVDGYMTAKNKELADEMGVSEQKISSSLGKLEAAGKIYREISQRRGVDKYPHRIIILIPERICSAKYENAEAMRRAVHKYVHQEYSGILEKWHQEVGYDPKMNAWNY